MLACATALPLLVPIPTSCCLTPPGWSAVAVRVRVVKVNRVMVRRWQDIKNIHSKPEKIFFYVLKA